jgi:hypothetical protein
MGSRLALAALVAGVTLGTSCASSSHAPAGHPLAPGELALRESLGIPDDAKQVLILAQTSHLDIDWQQTFSSYYGNFVETAFLQARQILDSQPRAFYSIAEMAYLQQHVQAHPEELAPLQADAARGALRIVGGGMTSPDTLLPESEMLFRDLLYGVQFSEDTFGVTPRAAWLPDSFGHSGTVPDVLSAAGFTSVAFSRIDGSPTIFQEILHPDAVPPLPGSTAALLQQLGSADFHWHGPGGGAVLAHFISGTGLYCEGENIDYDGDLETPGSHVGDFEGTSTSFTDARIDGYAAENTPYAKTPYLFVPVGCDFEPPKAQLIAYADGYNQRQYPTTGVWAVAAPFEIYAQLVAYWSDVLPDFTGELSPAYMGFFDSRSDVKRAVRDAARPFFVAETFATALGDTGTAIVAAARPELSLLTRTDHHDFVTGTSADPVVSGEQMPMLAQAQQAGESAESNVAAALAPRVPLTPGAVARLLAFNASSATVTDVAQVDVPIVDTLQLPLTAVVGGQPVPLEVAGTQPGSATVRVALTGVPPWSWTMVDLLPGTPAAAPAVSLSLLDASGGPATGAEVARVVLSNAHVRAQFDAGAAGFALTSLSIDGTEGIAAPSITVTDYADMGGLWRLGNEMGPGCTLTPMPPAALPSTVQVIESTALEAHVAFVAPTFTVEASVGAGASGLDLAVATGAAEATTRTVTLSLAAPAEANLITSSPAGWQLRAPTHIFDPTFYPAVGWAEVAGWAVLLRQSTGVRMATPGVVELMTARDARTEQCDVMGGTGSDPGQHRIEWRIERVVAAADAERAAQSFDRPLDLLFEWPLQAATTDLPAQSSLASADGDAVLSAIKPADRGGGVVLRALLMPGPGTLTLSPSLAGRQLTVVDLAERNGTSLGTAGTSVALDPATYGGIAGFRLE